MSQENESGKKAFVASAADLEAFRRVKLDSNQKVAYAGADELGIGTLPLKGPSSANEQVTVKLWNFPGTRKVVCAGAVAKGAFLYCMANGKFDDASESGGPAAGIALEAGSGDNSVIEAHMLLDRPGGLLFAALADSAAVTNTTTATLFDKKKTIDGNILKKGDVLRVRAQGIATATNATDTLKAELMLGTEVIADTGALDVANNDIFAIDAEIVIVDVGASGKVRAMGWMMIGAPGTVKAAPFRKAEVAEDLSVAALDIAVRATWSVANAGNSCKLEILSVEHIKQ